jgi:hypothetical protein
MKHALALTTLLCGWMIAHNSYAEGDGLSYKGISINFGGFLASETVYRTNNTASDIGTSFNKLPFPNSVGYGMSEFRGTERQSRFSLLAKGDVDSNTHLSGYYELDFLGTTPTSNANESNSYAPRTRHVYMNVDWDDSGFHLLAGQTWSLVTMNAKGITPRNEYIAPDIDAQYAPGFNWARQWQLRAVKDFDKTFWLAVSLENAQTVGVAGNLAAGTGNTYQVPAGNGMSANMSMNGYPDVIAKFAWESALGHYEVYNLMRNFQSRYGAAAVATQTNKQNTWTDAVGGGFTVPVPGLLEFTVSGLFGRGIGRYGTSQLTDATYNADGSLNPLNGTQYLAQLVVHATDTLDVYAQYGQEQVDSATGTGYGYGDGVVASNNGCTTLGGNCAPNLKSTMQYGAGLWWSFYKGGYGAAKLGAQYSHTKLDTYADATGFAPNTSIDMVFTSLRYYPF